MTAAEEQANFEANFLSEEPGNSNILISENDSDKLTNCLTESSDVSSSKEDKKESFDSNDKEFSGSCIKENSAGDHSNQDSKENMSESTDNEWLDIMGSGDFKKKIIKSGVGVDTRPNKGDRVVADLSCYVQGKLFEEKTDFSFIVGDLDVVQGIDLVVCLMEKGEKSKVMIPSKLAYGSVGLLPDVPPDTAIECDIELKEIEALDEDALTISERLKLGNEKRCRGNFFYDRSQYLDAIHCYERAAEYLDGVRDGSDSTPEKLQEIVNLRIKVYNNMAASHLKLNAYSAALKSVESVLKVQPKNVKALFRKGKILGIKGSTEEAIACMKTAASLEPETKVIQAELTKLRNRKRKDEETQKAMYQRMFKSETKEITSPASRFSKWSVISCGILALAIGSAVAYKQLHT